MQKGFMIIDEDTPLDFKVPGELQEWIDALEKAFIEGDEVTWDHYHEYIGEFAKNEYSCGNITAEQRDAIWYRYVTAG